jgi:hypothetical protein
MPDFLLRKNSAVPPYPNTFLAILPMDDGYELEVGQIAQQTGRSMDTFWGGRALGPTAALTAGKVPWRRSKRLGG